MLPFSASGHRPLAAGNRPPFDCAQGRLLTVYCSLFAFLLAVLAPRAEAGVAASGGTVSSHIQSGTNYIVHTFTTVGATNFNVTSGGDVEVLVVAGGGGGGKGETNSGGDGAGGGGAGGYVYSNSVAVVAGSNYTVTVGAGGTGSTNIATLAANCNGSNSVFGAIIAFGGGGGGSDNGDYAITNRGASGGSGGGAASFATGVPATETNTLGGAGTNGQGNAGGGSNSGLSSRGGGGGGGATAAGTTATTGTGAAGGAGTANSISGSSVTYAGGGGGGGCSASGGAGGSGGGGKGGTGASATACNGTNATVNTGGGGGGGGGGLTGSSGNGGNGGSGIVIVRYAVTPTPSQMKITFGGYTNRSEVLTNFPVLVVFSNNINNSGFHYGYFATTNGTDLRFGTDATLPTTGLNYEIESWNPNGASFVWVQVPTIPPDGSGAIWANWGNTGASNQLACTTNGATWTEGYTGVWHLANSGGSLLLTDSANTQRAAGTPNAAVATNVWIDGAVSFTGTTSRIDLGKVVIPTNNGTVSFWWRPTNLNDQPVLTSRRDGAAGLFDMYLASSSLYCGWYKNNTEQRVVTNVTSFITVGNWYFVSLTWIRNGIEELRINGVSKGTQSNLTNTWDTSTTNLYLNAPYGGSGGTNYFVDEVTLSSVTRSTNWIYACYLSQASNTVFNNYGAVTNLSSGLPIIANLAATNVTTTSACFNGLLSDTGTAACAVCVLWGEQNGGATWNWANTNWFNDGAVNDAWANNTPFTTNITLTGNKTYYYTYAATNAATNAVASGAKSLVTGLVTVEATTNTARYFPRTNGLYTIYRPDTCTNEAMTVYYTMSGTATNGVHYDSLPLTAQFNAGATSTVVTLAPKFGGVGTAILTLAGDYNYPTGAQNAAIVTIDPSSISPYVYVVQSGSSPAAPYDSWATAATNIQTAVDYAAAKFGDGVNTVIVSNGTYNISVEITISAAITVRSFGNSVTGGLANASNTIVKVTGGSGNRRIFVVTADATVDGFTMRDAVRSSGTMLGGGAYVNASGAVVKNCIMVNNNGDTLYGGGVYIDSNGGLVQNCTITGNGNADRVIGGGVYMKAGTVSNCVVSVNYAGAGTARAGGIYASGGLVDSCWIFDNVEGAYEGGGIVSDGSGVVVRNCVIRGNTAITTGGGVQLNSGTIENCTIVGNNAAGSGGGGGIYRNGSTAGTVRNCIVVGNTSGHATYKNSYSGTSGWTYNCTALPDVAGTGCTNADPLFRNFAEGNYQLSAGSPCIDTGNDAAVTWGTDMAGNARKQDIPGVGTASVDMGAYEYNSTLSCDFLASPRALIASPTTYQSFGPAPLTVQFTGWADGTNLTGLVYRWDFDNDGNYDDESGPVVSHTYNTAGVYNPRLQVTNSTAEVAEKLKSAYVSAGNTHYVRTNSPGASFPYTSWATAASNDIQAAVNAATLNGSVVIVSNGTYGITSQITNINILTVRSFERGLGGASNTVVQRTGSGSHRIFSVGNANAVIEGLTMANGWIGTSYYGGGVNISAGLVRDCIIRNNGNADNGSGGGVQITGGTVSNCVIKSNSKGAGNRDGGGGVWASGGLITHCQITDNTVGGGDDGGGLWMSGGTIRNCLIRNNSCDNQGGGVWMNNAAVLVESCSIVTNRANGASNAGGGVYRGNGTVRNCVVCLNTASNNTPNANYYATGGFEYSASDPQPPPTTGAGNILAGVTFQDPAANDYRLKACAAVDAGTNQTSWMTGALDLAGTNRIIGGIVDMGAYEYVGGALECSFAANVTTVLAPANVVFTATLSGNTNGLFCWWDFGNGTTNGANLRVVTNLYSSPGVYTVSLMASNAISEISAATNVAYITVWATNAYVWTNSPSPAAPYTNWATAARLIATAVAAAPAGVTLWVTNGTYNETAETLLYKRITVRSVEGNLSGASNTIVRPSVAGTYRLFSVSDANAVLQGLTIQDSAVSGYANGNGIYMSDGLVRDCIIRNNGFVDNHLGSGVYMIGGTVSNCVVKNNGGGSNVDGSGIYATGGSILSCQILDNALSGIEGISLGGGGIYANGAVLIRNCLIARNSAGGTVGGRNGGGVNLVAGTIESCTIVSNSAAGANGGGGVYRNGGTAGTISNSIVYFNTASASTYSNFYTTVATGIGYTCTTNPVVAGTGCISDDPLFVNLAGGDYSLRIFPTLSPCIDAGTNQTWMAGAKDLAGADRKLYGSRVGATGNPIVDMGAYEIYVPPKGSVFIFR